jgi:peptidyl-prolyl cis-trans isomerase D
LLQATNASDETEMATLIARADSLKGALRAGATFEDLAAKHSDDPGSKANGGFYDFFTRGRMVAPFENFCFENIPGTVEAVETNFGVHLIEIMDHTKSMRKVSVAVIDRPLAPSSETLRNAKKDAREFAKSANDKDSFMSAAGDAGYPTNMASDIRRGAISISGLRNAAEVVSWAFNSEESEVSKPFLIDEAYVVAFLDQVSKDGIPPFDHVKEAMRTGATREAKADLYVAQMGSGTLEEIATAVNTKVLTTNNMALKFPTIKTAGALAEPEVVGLALAIPIGNISQPIVGENGVWVISPISIAEADEKTDFLTEQSNLLARARGAATLRVSNAMLEAANVVDNRSSN